MDRTAGRLVGGMALLVVTDAVGGLLAVAADVNTWGGAWGGAALLAAPAPMVAAQVLLTALAVRRSRRREAVPAGLLAAACLVSVASGFFDGGLGNDRLGAGLAAFQVFLLLVTTLVGLLAAARAVAVARTGRARHAVA
jgi:uncharacterized membrane protein (UPF0136 family)